jgi:hypothetical protein
MTAGGRPAAPISLPHREHTTCLPAPEDAARLTRFLGGHPRWSVFWDKAHGVWRAAEDDPDSALYTESEDATAVISYITAHDEPTIATSMEH